MKRTLLTLAIIVGLAGCDSTTSTLDGLIAVRYVVDAAPSAIAFADVDGTSQTSSTGRWEHRFDAPNGTPLMLEANSADGTPVTAWIYVNNVPFRAKSGSMVRLSTLGGDYDYREVEVEGFIEALSADRLTVRGIVFLLTDRTRFFGDDGEPIDFAALQIGSHVEAEGRARCDGIIEAEEIELEDGDDEDEVEVEGRVESVDETAQTITVAGFTFFITEATEFEADDGEISSLADLAIGDPVEVEGFYDADGFLHATEVEREHEHGEHEDDDDDECGD